MPITSSSQGLPASTDLKSGVRISLWYALLLFVMVVFILRLFYLQVIRHDYYKKAALQGQLKQYEIPAERGVIEAHDGTGTLPIVLNETKYTLFADPKFIKDPEATASSVQKIIGGNTEEYTKAMKANSRYAILAKKLTKEQRDKVYDLKLKGVAATEQSYRTYPQGELGAQMLGFVNDDNEGKYGVEQALSDELRGTPGELKAITDAQGIPLVTNKDNIETAPKSGKRVLLTIDVSMQKHL